MNILISCTNEEYDESYAISKIIVSLFLLLLLFYLGKELKKSKDENTYLYKKEIQDRLKNK